MFSNTFIPSISRNIFRILSRNFSSTFNRHHPVIYANALTDRSDIHHNIQSRFIFGKRKNESEDNSEIENNIPLEEVDVPKDEKIDPKILELQETLAKKDEELKNSNKKYLYALAEMENTRKMLNQQIQDTKLFAIQNFTRDLLGIADTLESAVKSVKSADFENGGEGFKNFFDGVKMTESNLQRTFSNHGLERINPLGEKFDPTYHESAFLMPGEDPGTVGEVRSAGYLLNGRLLRPSLVGVIQEKTEEVAKSASNESGVSAVAGQLDPQRRIIYKLVLTGGPVAGKTTTSAELRPFFENIGWKVYQVPEAATILLSCGPKPQDFTREEVYCFQLNVLRLMFQLERTFEELAQFSDQNCIIICDRGTMDGSAYCDAEVWERLIKEMETDTVTVRDARYNLIIHLVTAARGALHFYEKEKDNNPVRTETAAEAIEKDDLISKVWLGHPYVEVIDNSTDFDGKIRRVKEVLCGHIGIDVGDRLHLGSKKRKFLIMSMRPDEDFDVRHDYIDSPDPESQTRIRKRGQNAKCTYTCTVRRLVKGETAETRRQITAREYEMLVRQRSVDHAPIYKLRRCFIWANQYYQLDVYKEPCTQAGRGMIILETYTTQKGKLDLPQFLEVSGEITGERRYSMHTISTITKQDASVFTDK